MTTATIEETDRLAALVEKKHDCLIKLRELGQRQMEYVRESSMSALLELLAYKQKVITLLGRLERAMDPFREQDPATRQWSSEAKRLECGRRIAESRDLLNEVMEQEKESEREMTIRRDSTAHELQGMHVTGQVCNAYSQHSNQQRG